ncbi:MAG: CdaR family protein [Thermodesulfobacteriota bacterium]
MTRLFRSLFGQNLGVKLLSLILAVALWYTAVGREWAEVGLNVPLEMVNFPSDMVVANRMPDGISVRIRGSVALTRQVAERNLRFSLDMALAKPGTNRFTLQPDALSLPRGLEVTHLAPNEITVELEQLVTKKVGLLPVIKGEPVAGYIIDDISLEPKQVELRGPASVVEPVDILWTEPVDVTTLSASTTVITRPNVPDNRLKLVRPVNIEVRLKIGEKVVTRDFPAVPVQPRQPAGGALKDFRLDPETVNLTVRGPVNLMSKLAAGQDISVQADLSGLGPGRYLLPVIVTVPERFEVVKVEPGTIEVEILGDIIGTNDG